MGKKGNTYKVSVVKPEEKRLLGILRLDGWVLLKCMLSRMVGCKNGVY